MSNFGSKVIIASNKIFPKVIHPFNLENEGKMTYSEWEYNNGNRVLSYYLPLYNKDIMFKNKKVLDVGCGAGGKSVFYSTCGANQVIGIDIDSYQIEKAKEFAKQKNCLDKVEFICDSALNLPFSDDTFDTVIMNDFFEHVSSPTLALQESLRVLKKEGKLYLNFPPYSHPWGEHLSDGINMPWVHKFFSEDSMIRAYKDLIKDTPDYEYRMKLRFTEDENGILHNTYINKMTKKQGEKIINSSGAYVEYHNNLPLKKSLKFITKTTSLFTGMCIYVLKKGN